MCNKCNSTVVEALLVTVPATPLLAQWEGWKNEDDKHFVSNRVREFMHRNYKQENYDHWHNGRKYRNGEHKVHQRSGHDTAKYIAKAKPYMTRDVTTLLDMEPLAHYIHHMDNINRAVANIIEPALFTAMWNFNNGTWEAIEVMRDLHPHGKHSSVILTTEQRERYEASWAAFHKFNALHRVHVSTEDINQIAYYPTLKHMRDGREVRTRLGRYLTKYQEALALSDLEVKSIAEKHASNMQSRGGWTVSFKEHDDVQGWLDVYGSEHVSSCMQNESAVRVYAHELSTLRLAYVQAGDRIVARCIVRDGIDQGWLRVYPDPNGSAEGRYLLDNLKANGYENRTNLDGVLLQYITTSNGSTVCPYLDSGDNGSQTVGTTNVNGKTYLRAGDGEMNATNTNGYCEDNSCSCDNCGDSYSEDELNYIEHDGNHVCEYCRDQMYTYAYGRRHEDYFPEDECIRVGDDWYWTETLDHHDIYICERDGEYYHMDDMTQTVDGLYHNEYVVCVDHPDTNGDDWIYQDKVHILSDDTTCHVDQADEYQAEIDAEEREREMMVEAMQA